MSLRNAILVQRCWSVVLKLAGILFPGWVYQLPERPRPTGEFPVGVTDLLFTTDDNNKAIARIWYPAIDTHSLSRRPLLKPGEYRALQQENSKSVTIPGAVLRAMVKHKTWAFEDAKLAVPKEGTLPVVVFSHGLGMQCDSNSVLCEHLASQGFIVLSVAQPHSAGYVCFDDGSVTLLDPALIATFHQGELISRVQQVLSASSVTEREQATRSWSDYPAQISLQETWIARCQACLSHLLDHPHKGITGAIAAAGDFSALIAAGMSFGGSVSCALAHRDIRFCAAVNLDGGQIGLELMNKDIRVPTLVLHSTQIGFASLGTFNDFHYQSYARAGTTDKVFRAYIRGAAHNDFTDLTLTRGTLRRAAYMLGNSPPYDFHNPVNQLCGAFCKAVIHQPEDVSGFAKQATAFAADFPCVEWVNTEHVGELNKSTQTAQLSNGVSHG